MLNCHLWLNNTEYNQLTCHMRELEINSEIITHFNSSIWQLHVVEYPEDDAEQVLPPVLGEPVTIRLHHLKHHGQRSEKQNSTQ